MNRKDSIYGKWSVCSETGLLDGTCDLIRFSYTVGLKHLSHPDLMVVDLDEKVSFELLDQLTRQIVRGAKFEPGERRNSIFEGFTAEIRPVSAHYLDLFEGATETYGGMNELQKWGMLQVVWPDQAGLFPWDEKYMLNNQKLFALPAERVWT